MHNPHRRNTISDNSPVPLVPTMRGSTILPVLISVVAIGVVVAVFSQGASPYITVAEARKLSSDRLNLGLDLDKKSISKSIKTGAIEFDGKDKNGEKIHVVYKGDPVNNLDQADRVTAIGKLDGDKFVAEQLLTKCPSKYEAEKK